MARKKKDPRQEELELEQAYVELTGYNIHKKKEKSGSLIGLICILAVILAGCVLAIPMLLEREQTPTEATGPSRIAPGTTVLGVDVGGMTREEAAAALEAVYQTDMTLALYGEEYAVSSVDTVSSADSAVFSGSSMAGFPVQAG